MTPLESAAQALAGHFTPIPWGRIPRDKTDLRLRLRNDPGHDINEPTKDDLFAAARAVLAAIREPSDRMFQAGLHPPDPNVVGAIPPLNVWQAMIDAALEEGV